MPRSDSAPEGSATLQVKKIEQENYYRTELINETAFQARLTKLNKSALMKQYQDRLDIIAQERSKVLKNEKLKSEDKNKALQKWAKRRETVEARIQALKLENEKRAYEETLKFTQYIYNQRNISERRQLQQTLANVAKEQQVQLSQQIVVKQAELERTKNGIKRRAIEKEIRELEAKSVSSAATEAAAKSEVAKFDNIIYQTALKTADSEREKVQLIEEQLKAKRAAYEEETKTLRNDIATTQDALNSETDEDKKSELEQKLSDLINALNETRETFEESSSDLNTSIVKQTVHADAESKKKTLQDRITAAKEKQTPESKAEQKELDKLEKQAAYQEALAERGSFGSALAKNADPAKLFGAALQNLTAKINDSLKQIDSNINSMFQYQAQINARLNGTDDDYSGILKTIRSNIGINPLVSQKAMVENVKKLVDSGVTFDLEQRAFLATISDRIVNTFDAFDANLLRVIRLQQADSTAARLGMESALNELLNAQFSDSSYLNDVFDSVAGSIIDASAQLSRDASIEFEYIVQKWLGSLYSLGLSSNTISTIAQGIDYLGTGNVQALSSNESLQSLFAMSATRAGISYSDLLTKGLDASNTNALMKSMVEYLKEIANNSNNNVTAAAYANVFGMNTTDLVAINNLQQTEIDSLYKSTLTASQATTQLQNEMNQMYSRTHVSQLLETGLDNLMTTASTAIGSNLLSYGTWKILNIVEDLTGGIAIPAVSVFGNMVDLHTTVTQLAKAGIAGLSLMGSLIGGLSSLSTGGAMSLKTWNFDQYTSRGSTINSLKSGIKTGFSASSEMNATGSGSGSDIKSSTLADGASSAEEDAKTTNASVEKESGITESIYKAIAEESGNATVLTELVAMHALIEKDRVFKAELGGFNDLKDLVGPNRVFYSALVGVLPTTGSSLSIDNNMLRVSDVSAVSNYLTANKTNSLVEVGLSNLVESSNSNTRTSISNLAASLATMSTTNALTSTATTMKSETSTNSASNALAAAFRKALTTSTDDNSSLMDIFKQILTKLDAVNVNVTNDNFEEVLQKLVFRN